MAASPPKKKANAVLRGKVVATVPGFVLVEPGRKPAKAQAPKPAERTAELLSKAARALNRPGIRKEAVFKGRTANVYSYSVDTSDVTRVVRVSPDGKRSVGRLVGDRFVPMKAA